MASEGFELVRQALHDLGLSAPSSLAGIMGSLILHRSWFGARGLGFRQRAESELQSDELARIDALMACSNTFVVVDPPRGIEFSARQVLRALRAGEPSRVAVALATTANGMIVSGGQRTWERGQSLMEHARGLARQTDNPYLNAYLVNIDGIMHWTSGRFRSAMALTEIRVGGAVDVELFRLGKDRFIMVGGTGHGDHYLSGAQGLSGQIEIVPDHAVDGLRSCRQVKPAWLATRCSKSPRMSSS